MPHVIGLTPHEKVLISHVRGWMPHERELLSHEKKTHFNEANSTRIMMRKKTWV